MATSGNSAAASHVGRVRANNQDSAYAGTHLFIVADGMGGHAGGDVASAITVKHVVEADRIFTDPDEAAQVLHDTLIAANHILSDTVIEHNELTGMGTTVSGMVRVGNKMAMAHIGDSRIYLLRDGEMKQITHDHTFVQRLVESGRITLEEAAVHPRRSVLMRVLGDVDASPEIDTEVFDTRSGDRWLLCSDGLSSFVTEDKIAATLRRVTDPDAATERLVQASLDQGAPDNVTVVLVDIGDDETSAHVPPLTVGSAASPLSFEPTIAKKPIRLPNLLLHPLKATQPDDSHFEPESDEYYQAIIREDRRRVRRRHLSWIAFITITIAAIAGGLIVGYQYTQQQFYVGADDGQVAIYQGVQQDIGPISMSHVYQVTDIRMTDLPLYRRASVENTINAHDLEDARRIVRTLSDARLP
ncbi:Stp1/IreP family PP2C-type Ser/Thr phosphatase [Salinibacterium sp. M195]|uniref:Stp1/IreP family PP2C-type Ser/Thr phosphatase n=1 Tax=Salinibacterium sp. M195 TaxID=2583374 RepID=UPI001C633619|nr:Stp1/IreP family PP2C-type Ser/Thr phosphatase [Salinibacterium sp. M195]QYH34859.1 Stp1/IreP family PP2C-type Ser/Thr phosphatase [Salinibacterium sp. M195]